MSYSDTMARPKAGDVIAVWFSCGAASAVAAKVTIDTFVPRGCTVRVVNNPVIEEDPDNLRFLKDVEKWLGVTIEIATNRKYPECSARAVWEKRRFMSGPKGAPCTTELKKNARQQWEEENHVDWHVLGFTSDETKRYDRFVTTERENVLPVLIHSGITKDECFEIIERAGLVRPRVYAYHINANCHGCVKATSPKYWNLVRKHTPEVFADRAEQSRRLGAKLVRVKGVRIFLDELPPEDATTDPSDLNIDCGIFCEERSTP